MKVRPVEIPQRHVNVPRPDCGTKATRSVGRLIQGSPRRSMHCREPGMLKQRLEYKYTRFLEKQGAVREQVRIC